MGGVPKHVNRNDYIPSKIGDSFQKNLKKALYITPTGYRYQRINGVGGLLVAIQVLRDFSS